jgi:hypothetical protein
VVEVLGVTAYRRIGPRNRSSEGRICEPGVVACESERQSVRCKDHAREVRFVKTQEPVGFEAERWLGGVNSGGDLPDFAAGVPSR